MANEKNLDDSAFSFHGNWREFAPIALTNIALTIVTLGIYRFWGTTRERQYFWSQTQFIDERLEWTGKGLELFFGFLLAIALIFIPYIILIFAGAALIANGYTGIAVTLGLVVLMAIFTLFGIAIFRGLRYKLSRTYWHGIRGGSDDNGIQYGLSYVWKTIAGYISLGLLVPWSMVQLWNDRWGQMSFGQHQFSSNSKAEGLLPRFLLFYVSPIIMFVIILVAGLFLGGIIAATGSLNPGAAPPVWLIVFIVPMVLAVYLVIPAIWLVYYALFYRTVIGGLKMHTLEFEFSARTKDWLKLLLGDAALWLGMALVAVFLASLVLIPMGYFSGLTAPVAGVPNPAFQAAISIGFFITFVIPLALIGPFLRYRHWKFFINHMQAFGDINLAELTQSDTKTSKHGEGLLDAFDVGAI
jgi:uncharacterized membrane protein YjgN (DUF898 family)